MEVNGKKETLAGLFLRFAVLFCVMTVVIVGGVTLLLIGSSYLGVTLPANYAEVQLNKNMQEIQTAGEFPEQWIPKGCTYGVYTVDGTCKSGTFSENEQENAWNHYEKKNIYASNGEYFRFIKQNTGDICIVKYDLRMKYSLKMLNDVLPSPEVLSFILDAVLFILNAVFLSRYFAKKLNRQLGELRGVTEKIAENDLDFPEKSSEILEIDEVMNSLSHLKSALKDSLNRQWDMERQKQEQLSSLAHDIKTPLTIIRGNAELLEEGKLSAENMECTEDILSNVKDIEKYLERMRQVLSGREQERTEEVITCTSLGEMLRETACKFAAIKKIPIAFQAEVPDREMLCCASDMIRAWNNLLSNAVEYTEKEKGIEVRIQGKWQRNQEYMVVSVRDFGSGFTEKDLKYADSVFYSGDASRHDRTHQGLGLAIAKKFLNEQGGFLQYGNHADGGGEVSMWIACWNETKRKA